MEEYAVGDIRKFIFTCYASSGVIQNITGATMTCVLKNPLGGFSSLSGSIISGSAGTFSYTTVKADLANIPGVWSITGRAIASDGSYDITVLPPIQFRVYQGH